MGQNFSSEPVVEKDTERDQNDTFNVAVSSCQGWRMSQEDNHSLILDLPGEHKASFFAVYDGHGSARVSKHASESLWLHLTENEHYIKGDFKHALEEAFLTFDREVNESYNAQLAGTTAVCVLIVDNIIYCANIGDSRSVACVNCECIPLSHDHKPENPQELKRILAAGGYVLGNRVNGNLALSRAFGDFHYKGNEQLPPEQQIVSPCPDIKLIELNDDVDFIVLACDGIWDVLSSEEVVNFVINRLERNIEPGLICEQLTTRCLATDYELVIGCDNMTVLLVCYTRGRSWVDYCTDIFNKNSKKLGIPDRIRTFADPSSALDEPSGQRQNSSVDHSSLTNSSDNRYNSATEDTFATSDMSIDRQMRILLDVFGAEPASTNSDDTPPNITEVSNEENETILDNEPTTTADERKDPSLVDEKDEQPIETSGESQEAARDDELQAEQSSKTTEIHLSSPDEENNSSSVKGGETTATPENGSTEPSEEIIANTIEIELVSPDDEKSETNDGEQDVINEPLAPNGGDSTKTSEEQVGDSKDAESDDQGGNEVEQDGGDGQDDDD